MTKQYPGITFRQIDTHLLAQHPTSILEHRTPYEALLDERSEAVLLDMLDVRVGK